MAVGKTSFQVALVISPLPTAGNGEALLLGSFAFGGMPETSVARGRAGGGQAPQEGFALEIFQNADLSTGTDLCNLFLFVIFPVYSSSLGIGVTGIQRLKVKGFTVKQGLKVKGFTVKQGLKVKGFTVISTT